MVEFDAIVVGSGATGGWAAKELTERGLKVLMLERGRPLEHRSGYVTEHMPPWDIPLRNLQDRELNRTADNRVVLDARRDRFDVPQLRFEVTYRDNERRMGEDIVRESIAMFKAGGATDIVPYTSAYIPGTSVHEFGGARMGKDPRESVLNEHNQAHGVANLFVTDGACMPSGSCVNPTLTFMALTARAAEYAVAELKANRI